MPINRKRLFLFPSVFLFPLFAQGAVRYVNNSGSPACSNSTSFGSLTQPWCTISYGISNISGGDTLYMRQGTYNEELYFPGPAGTASQNTIIQAYPGEHVIVRGAGNTGRVRITNTRYITFDGFEITNLNQGIHVDTSSDHIVVQNNTVHDVGQEGIHVKDNSSFVTVQGNTIFNTEKLGGCCNGEGIYVGTSTSGALDNTHDVIVRNNTIHDVTDEGIEIKPGTHDCLVEGNTISVTNLSPDSPYAGIEINERDASPQTWSGNPNHIVRNNLLHDNKHGIRLGTGSTAYNNVVYNTASGFSGIIADNINGDSFTRSIYHNTIGHTAGAITVSGATAIVKNNIGSSLANNLPYNSAYFVNAAARDYRLVSGAAPINAGVDLTAVVPTDFEGAGRVGAPDLGAYEFGGTSASRCDMNSDGSTTVVDVQLCVNQAISITTCGTGDINSDGDCNVIDVQSVVNAALGGQCVTQ